MSIRSVLSKSRFLQDSLCRMKLPLRRFASKWEVFDSAEMMGVHVLPTHFSSPLPVTRDLGDDLWDGPICEWNLDPAPYLAFISGISGYATELSFVPETGPPGTFFWANPAFYRGDAELYYSLLRCWKPRRLLEIGSGYSTLVAKLAARKQPLRIEAIEPFPHAWLEGVADEMLVQPVQEIPLSRFESLEAGDLLFIDSTHISKAGSDVNYLFLKVLPRLKDGVIVHVHDVCLPFEYPKSWIKQQRIFYTEQYLLGAMLHGSTGWEILVPYYWLSMVAPAALREAFPDVNPPGGGSFWMRRRSTSNGHREPAR